jgi:hypothetical protein
VALLRLAEVAVDQPPQVEPVLLRQRLVEPVVLAEGLNRRRVVDRTLAEIRGGGIARDELRQRERDERDADREQNERDEAPDEKAEERLGRPRARPPQPERADRATWNRQR